MEIILQDEEINRPYRNRNWLFNEYLIKDRQAKDIAKECGINQRTLREWISIHDLPNKHEYKIRDLSKDILYQLYVIEHKTSPEIAEIYKVSDKTICDLLRKYDIHVNTRSEALKIYYEEKGGYEKAREKYGSFEHRVAISCRQHNISIEEFNGFSTTEQHMIRNSSEYRNWRKEVYERDDYTCQCCGKRGGNINVHHIENFNENIESRIDINNGITLCVQCHLLGYENSFHSIYGEKGNNKEQLLEFLKLRNSQYIDKWR